MKNIPFTRQIFVLALAMNQFACGTSVFQSMEKSDAAEDATSAMEHNNPGKAIIILKNALSSKPNNHQYLSLLSTALAQKYGVDTISIAIKMADNQTSSSASTTTTTTTDTSSNGVTTLFSVLPAATDANIAGVQSAVNILISIPQATRTTADNFMLTLLNTAMLGLAAKKLDTNGDGVISPVEILQMSAEDATTILTSLLSASEAAGLMDTKEASTAAVAANISTMKTAIDSASGSTDAEKLQNYLQTSSISVKK